MLIFLFNVLYTNRKSKFCPSCQRIVVGQNCPGLKKYRSDENCLNAGRFAPALVITLIGIDDKSDPFINNVLFFSSLAL